jgi:flavin reductase
MISSTTDAFKRVMRRFPTGVTVVTSVRDGEPRGMTLSSFASVAAAPPTVLVCVNREARSYLYIAHSLVFCVNLLALEQRALAERFSGLVRERQFDGIAYRTGVTGAPVLDGTIAYLECRVMEEHPIETHSLFVGRVVACDARGGRPLGYFDGAYHDFGVATE